VVKELIQNDLNLNNIKNELNLILNDAKRKEQISNDYAALQTLLSSGGNASENAANEVIKLLS
jgi:lipid-A-disaccharide synthase